MSLSLSFILIVRDGAERLPDVLAALAGAMEDGDEALLIDDGSADDSPRLLAGFAPGAGRATPVRLGRRSPGGIGIAANIGLARAQGDAVLALDDRSAARPGALAQARALLARGADMVLAPGGGADPAAPDTGFDSPDPAADPALAALWRRLLALDEGMGAERRAAALALPARTPRLIRREFLDRHGLRYPDSGLPRSEIPFHREGLARAGAIGLAADPFVLRLPAPPLPEEDMAAEALALPAQYRALADPAPEWGLATLARDLDRVPDGWLWEYAVAAAEAFGAAAPASLPAPQARLLARLRLDPGRLALLWLGERAARRLAALEAGMAELREEVAGARRSADLARDEALARRAAAEFEALRALEE